MSKISEDAIPRSSITVPGVVADVFQAFVERPLDWVPHAHRMSADTRSMIIEPFVGGRFYEVAGDGSHVIRGIVTEWAPPHRLAMTWRIGAGWRVLLDDDHAPTVEVEFAARSTNGHTDVTITYTHLDRSSPDFAQQLVAVVGAGGGPGETLTRFAGIVTSLSPTGENAADSGPVR